MTEDGAGRLLADPDVPAPADVLLRDGSVVVIRRAGRADGPALDEFHQSISNDNLRLRFFSASQHAAHLYAVHLVEDQSTLVLVVERGDRMVAVATAEPIGPEVAEVAFLVTDDLHGQGLGSLLLEHLAAAGRAGGVRRFVAEVLSDNRAMLSVFLDAGFTVTRRSETGSIHVEMDTVASSEALAAADERERHSETRSLQPLLYPRSVAIAGVRRDGRGVGAAVLRSVVAGGYTGDLAVVHRTARQIEDVPAYRRLRDIPGPVDLVVVTVPAGAVLATIEDAADAGIPAAVVISSGFAEVGVVGEGRQRALLELARRRSIRVVGPNCLGVLSNHPDIRLDATFSGSVPPPGGLAVAAQSGGVGIVLIDVARDLGLGIGSFVSLGNKADVSSNDLLAAWRDDPRVTAAALYLESFGNAPKFARVARRFAEIKPLLAVVGGRSAGRPLHESAGQPVGPALSIADAPLSVGVDALFAQAGVIACHGAEDMAETALLLAEQPLPGGPRVAIVSNAGGMGVLAADAADQCGLVVPELSGDLSARIAGHAPESTWPRHTLDVGAEVTPRGLAAISALLLDTDEVDAVVVLLVATGVGDAVAAMRAMARTRAAHPDKPLVLVPMGGLSAPPGGLDGITTYRAARPAMRAIARAARYAAWRATGPDQPAPVDRDRAEHARVVAERILAEDPVLERWLDVDQAGDLLNGHGLAPSGRAVPRPVVDDVEVALGLVRDPGFGPLIMVAAGGVASDLWDDRVFLLPPITPADAARAVRSLRIWPLLEGYHGSPPADVASLEELVVRLGELAEDVPQVAELDLNPVVVGPHGSTVVDVKVRLASSNGIDAGVPRRLRRDL